MSEHNTLSPELKALNKLFDALIHSDWNYLSRALDAPDMAVDQANEHGATLLMAAVDVRSIWLARRLLTRGANTDLRDVDGWTAFDYLVRQNYLRDAPLTGNWYVLNDEPEPLPKEYREVCEALEIADLFLAHRFDVNVADSKGYTPLFHACTNRATAMTTYLLEHGADIEARLNIPGDPTDGATPLMMAAGETGYQLPYYQNTACVQLLIRWGADLQATDTLGRNALIYAIENDADEHVEALLSASPDSRTDTLPQGTDFEHLRLILPACTGDKEGLSRALAQEIPIDNPTQTGRTALIWAAARGFSEGVGLLLGKGADARLIDSRGWSALLLAVQYGHIDVARLLLEHNLDLPQRTLALTAAIQRREDALIDLLLAHDAPLREGKEGPELINIALARRADILRTLHNDGEDVPLHIAAMAGDALFLEQLVRESERKHSDITLELANALCEAAALGYCGAILALKEQGGDISQFLPERNMTPLMYAAQAGHKDAVMCLLEAGADPDVRDEQGWVADEWAVVEGFPEIVQLMAEFRRSRQG